MSRQLSGAGSQFPGPPARPLERDLLSPSGPQAEPHADTHRFCRARLRGRELSDPDRALGHRFSAIGTA